MKFCRYVPRAGSSAPAEFRYGLLEGDSLIEISGVPWAACTR